MGYRREKRRLARRGGREGEVRDGDCRGKRGTRGRGKVWEIKKREVREG